MNGQTFSSGSESIPTTWSVKQCPTYENGWGFVIHFAGRTIHSAGRIPAKTLKRFCSRKAFIYFLEVTAQLIAFLAMKQFNNQLVLSFIDNTSGLFALQKGYCRDPAICNIVAVTWRLIAHLQWQLHLEWVSSDNNISDCVSRHDFGPMDRLGSKYQPTSLNSLFKILDRVAVDAHYTHGQALSDLLHLDVLQVQSSHAGGVADGEPVWPNAGAQPCQVVTEPTEINWHSKGKK